MPCRRNVLYLASDWEFPNKISQVKLPGSLPMTKLLDAFVVRPTKLNTVWAEFVTTIWWYLGSFTSLECEPCSGADRALFYKACTLQLFSVEENPRATYFFHNNIFRIFLSLIFLTFSLTHAHNCWQVGLTYEGRNSAFLLLLLCPLWLHGWTHPGETCFRWLFFLIWDWCIISTLKHIPK